MTNPALRIHIHTDCYWFGGSEQTMVVLFDELRAMGDRLTVSYRPSRDYEEGLRGSPSLAAAATPVHLPDLAKIEMWIGRSSSPLRRIVQMLVLASFARYIVLAIDILRMVRLLRRTRPDVLHVNNGGFPGAISCNAAMIAGALLRIPARVYVVNNMAVGYTGLSRRMDYLADRAVVSAVGRFVTGSSAAAIRASAVLRMPREAIEVIPNSTAITPSRHLRAQARQDLGIGENDVVVAVVARLERRKGHRVIFEALSTFPPHCDVNVVVLIAGKGPEQEELERQAGALGLASIVRFLGQVQDVAPIYAAADILALPSIEDEDFPLVILEAMANGLPVLSTHVSGIPEQVVDQETGYLVEPGDAAALAERLRVLVCESGTRAAMGTAGRARFEANFTPGAVARRYRGVYVSTLRVRERVA